MTAVPPTPLAPTAGPAPSTVAPSTVTPSTVASSAGRLSAAGPSRTGSATIRSSGTAPRTRRGTGHATGFWFVAAAFAVAMAFSTVPTPLWPIYRSVHGYSTVIVTIAFAAYALGVVVSLFLAGHVSDWLGRRPVLLPAVLLELVAAVLFLTVPTLTGILIARVLTGLAVGMITATATAHLAELDLAAHGGAPRPRAAAIATAANLGGLAVGPLVAGLLASFVRAPLTTPYLVFAVLLVLAALGVALVPETVERSAEDHAYRPQRIAVPATARGRYLAVGLASFALFAVLGLFTSLAPGFLAGVGATSPAVTGLAAFAVFAAAAISQVLTSTLPVGRQLGAGLVTTALGVVILALGVLGSSAVLFVLGGLVAGAGAGMLLKGSLATAAQLAPPTSRGEALAGVFLAAYLGLALPVLGLGVASAAGVVLRVSLLGFSVLVLVLLATSAVLLRRHPAPAGPTGV